MPSKSFPTFNYINRVADGLGVDLEPEMKRRGHRATTASFLEPMMVRRLALE